MTRPLAFVALLAAGGLAHAQPAADGSSFWAETDFLLWWVKGASLPPLVTRGTVADPSPGALGQPGTTVLYGGGHDDFGPLHGARLRAGTWVGCDRLWAFEAGGFLTDRAVTGFSAGLNGTTPAVLGIPANVVNVGETIYGVAGPGIDGRVSVRSTVRLWGLEATAYRNLFREDGLSVSALTGLRTLSLRENLDLTNGPPDGVGVRGSDHFGTRNEFYGGLLGARVGYQSGRLGLDLLTRVSVGVVDQGVNVNGSITFPPGAGLGLIGTFPGNSLTQPSNIGDRSRTRFAVLPEVGLKARYQLTDHLAASVGYDFLWIDRVVRPGDQIDRNVNTSQAPQGGGGLVGLPVPAARSEPSSFFAHGLNAGLVFSY